MLYYVILCYTMLYYIILHYTTLYYVILYFLYYVTLQVGPLKVELRASMVRVWATATVSRSFTSMPVLEILSILPCETSGLCCFWWKPFPNGSSLAGAHQINCIWEVPPFRVHSKAMALNPQPNPKPTAKTVSSPCIGDPN